MFRSAGSRRREPPPVRRGGGAARLGRRPAGVLGRGWTRSSTTSRRATASCWPGATSCRPASTTGTASTPARPTPRAYTAFLREIGYLLDEPADVTVTHRRRRRRGGPHRRPAARRPAAQRAVRHQRRERPLGLALRRALRLRRGPAARATSRPGERLQQGPRRRGHRPRPCLPRRALPAGLRARTPTPRRTPWTARGSP